MNKLMQDVFVGGYIPGDSMLHRLDPRTKLAGLAVLLVGVFATRTWGTLLFSSCLMLTLICLSGIGWRVWWWGLLRFSWMLIIVAGMNVAFTRAGKPVIVGQWTLPITQQGLQTGLMFAGQIMQAIILSMALTFTTMPQDLAKSFERVARPLKRFHVPVGEIGIVLLLAMRFVPLLQLELRTTIDAQKSRGVEFGHGGIISRCRDLIAVLVPALTGTLRRGDLLAVAMTARGFRPGLPRSEYRPLRFTGPDYGAFLFLTVFSLCRLFIFG
ncbi:MAG: energy-coupling factor transporter transmembrane component T [Desulfomonilaceae bacterium]